MREWLCVCERERGGGGGGREREKRDKCARIEQSLYSLDLKTYDIMILELESPPSEKHPWTTATLTSRSFAVTRLPHVSLHPDLILPRTARFKRLL